jgi:hypothetical protein
MAEQGLHRMGAACAIAGTIIAGISNSVHPALADAAGVVRNAAGSSHWIVIHWGLIVGIVVMQLGFYSVIDALRAPESSSWMVGGIYTHGWTGIMDLRLCDRDRS